MSDTTLRAREWLARTYAPAWLDLAGMTAEAAVLRGMDVSTTSWSPAYPATYEVRAAVLRRAAGIGWIELGGPFGEWTERVTMSSDWPTWLWRDDFARAVEQGLDPLLSSDYRDADYIGHLAARIGHCTLRLPQTAWLAALIAADEVVAAVLDAIPVERRSHYWGRDPIDRVRSGIRQRLTPTVEAMRESAQHHGITRNALHRVEMEAAFRHLVERRATLG